MNQPLTKENFFNDLHARFPLATQVFCNWIDQYKVRVKWTFLFLPGVKFHSLPYALQLGLWLEFVAERGGCEYEMDALDFNLREEITGYMEHILTPQLT